MIDNQMKALAQNTRSIPLQAQATRKAFVDARLQLGKVVKRPRAAQQMKTKPTLEAHASFMKCHKAPKGSLAFSIKPADRPLSLRHLRICRAHGVFHGVVGDHRPHGGRKDLMLAKLRCLKVPRRPKPQGKGVFVDCEG